ncbi:MAG TPA: ATP-dependent RNA helicase HrpA [Steroidobacteraceae bacterium]|jgi:ATP-dependent helicase HrpA|nr:ATP-dependent RNA helicase HrpA [Steroidobacteraceae bacterium]
MIDEDRAARLAAARAAQQFTFKHDPALPITARREAIVQALQERQVLIVAGDTGSGKSTQLPQYCLELNRGMAGLIAHTQPRRLAARALGARIAEEVGQALGRGVGFRVRFADQVSDATRLLLMTDGLLLAELTSDPLLRRYDTIIVDEAHERTLNVDLLLGVLKRLLPRRSDLKLIVTSATLDVERVSRFFDDAPIITVSGRSFPIELRYSSATEDEELDLPLAVLEACQEIAGEPGDIGNGDILVFLPGEREIRDVGELLERELQSRVEVLSLYSRLSWEQQSKIFQRGARQRIVLSTNVAETSITVPGIRAVVDTGLARISRYSVRNRLQRLPIEPIARASADQRKGRCGRLGAGLCLRLFTEEDYEQRAAFTEPEVLRTNLAALLLRLAADGLGQAEEFPFIDAPDSRALNDGYRLLQELQALDENRCITRRGRAMARLPLDPRLSRALLESKRFHAQRELLAIVSGLSVPDVRVGDDPPAGAAFEDSKSEFSGLLKLWSAYRMAREGPRRELRRWCKERHLSLLRLSEWDDVYTQVVDRARELGIIAQSLKASYTGVHRSLLAGFCTMVGARAEDGVYTGTRGVHFHIFPGSPLARRRPRWVMAAGIVETSRVFARRVAEIEPMWIEAAAAHLVKREYLEPDWDEAREEVAARERVTFLGLILSAGRVVNYGPIAPEESRRIFAREALVYQRLQRRPEWLAANDAAVREAQQAEERLRTRDLVQGAESFVDFYDQRLPRQVSSAATLEHFSRHLAPDQRAGLTLTPALIFARLPESEALERFPEQTRVDGLCVPVEYRFAPGEAQDGADIKVPLLALPGLTRALVDAAIPGLAAPRIEALLRSLPKEARRGLIPVAASAAEFLAQTPAGAADAERLRAWLKERRAVPEHLIRFAAAAIPAHLTAHLTILQGGQPIARGTDLAQLRRQCAAAAEAELERHARAVFPLIGSWRKFESDELPDRVPLALEQGSIWVYPTLRQRGSILRPQYEWTDEEAQRTWRQGAVRLARAMLERQSRDLAKVIEGSVSLLLSASGYLRSEELVDSLLHIAFRDACFADAEPPRTRDAFNAAVDQGRSRLYPCLEEITAMASDWLKEAAAVRRAVEGARVHLLADAAEETRGHLSRLFDHRILQETSMEWLRQLPRYLKAEQRRWQRNSVRGGEPTHIAGELQEWSARHQNLVQQLDAELRWTPKLDELRFWIEEYRVSLYAQELKTLGPISAARLTQRAAEIEAWLRR